jgi:hypothetical protein
MGRHTIETKGYCSIASLIAANSVSRLSAQTCRMNEPKPEDREMGHTSWIPYSFGCRIVAMML